MGSLPRGAPSRLLAASFSSLTFVACQSRVDPQPQACEPIAALVDAGLPDGAVWGFADLHAHLGIEKAFRGNLVWGSAVDDAPVNASELPRIAACPVEAHHHDLSSPVDRDVGAQVFPNVASLSGFAHAPVGSLGDRPTNAWPNARDVIHQAMNVASVRRAYEGGLRLMFASTTDDQVVSALLAGPNLVDGFIPDRAADYASAQAQLDWIEAIVEQNSAWMWIARSPAEARSIIAGGRLAVVLSLEMEGLRQEDVDSLWSDYAARHIIPIHLVDNDIGGTAANGNIFNVGSAAASAIYRSDGRGIMFMDLLPSTEYQGVLGWPQQIGTLATAPIYLSLNDVTSAVYQDLCYEPLGACQTATAMQTSFVQYGQQNARGLCSTLDECKTLAPADRPGVARIQHLMDKHMFVDVSHMSAQSVSDTLGIDKAYPFIASHTDVAHLCRGQDPAACKDETQGPITERALDVDRARDIATRGGVLGFGSGLGTYAKKTLFAARGGPLLAFSPATSATAACVASDASGMASAGCAQVPPIPPRSSGAITALHVQTAGGISGTGPNAHPFVRVEMRSPRADTQAQRQVYMKPLDCSDQACDTTVPLGSQETAQQLPVDATGRPLETLRACQPPPCVGDCTARPFTIDDIDRVTLEWLYLQCDADCQALYGEDVASRQCQSTWNDPNGNAPVWTIDEADLSAVDTGTEIEHVGPRDGVPAVRLDGNRGTFVLYERDDRGDTDTAVAVQTQGHLLKVSIRSAPGTAALAGASPSAPGANVCIAVRSMAGGVCTPAPPLAPGATECPTGDGWVALNQRGAWSSNILLYAFARYPADPSTACGLDVAILDWDPASPPFSVDEVRVEAIDDPVGHWVRRYAEVAKQVAGSHMGTLAFGTDFNGLNGTMEISEHGMPEGTLAASSCPAPGTPALDGGAPLPMAPMRFRNPDGTLGGPVLLEERGLATYGQLADLLAIVGNYPGCGPDVRNSLMLSAEATLRAWEAIDQWDGSADGPSFASTLPTADFDCGAPP